MSIPFVLHSLDINECSLNSGGCDQLCNNTIGSFQCSCNSGYTLSFDGRTCSGRIAVAMCQSEMSIPFVLHSLDINECSLNSGGCDQLCNNTIGSFQCSCNSGYTLNGDGITCSGRITDVSLGNMYTTTVFSLFHRYQ